MARNEMQPFASISLSPGSLPEGLSVAQGRALAALLAGRTMTSAAQAAGVNRTTVWRWANEDPEFIAFYNAAKAELAASAEQSLRLLTGLATVTLRRLMTRRSVPDAVKLAAAATVLRLARPADGPTDPKDARNAILAEARDRKRRSMTAELGMTGSEILKQLDRPRSTAELEELAEVEH